MIYVIEVSRVIQSQRASCLICFTWSVLQQPFNFQFIYMKVILCLWTSHAVPLQRWHWRMTQSHPILSFYDQPCAFTSRFPYLGFFIASVNCGIYIYLSSYIFKYALPTNFVNQKLIKYRYTVHFGILMFPCYPYYTALGYAWFPQVYTMQLSYFSHT